MSGFGSNRWGWFLGIAMGGAIASFGDLAITQNTNYAPLKSKSFVVTSLPPPPPPPPPPPSELEQPLPEWEVLPPCMEPLLLLAPPSNKITMYGDIELPCMKDFVPPGD